MPVSCVVDIVFLSYFLQTVLRQFQEYAEPDEASGGAATAPVRRVGANPQHASAAEAVEAVVLPLGENVLTENLGIPMVVVLTKVCNFLSWNI